MRRAASAAEIAAMTKGTRNDYNAGVAFSFDESGRLVPVQHPGAGCYIVQAGRAALRPVLVEIKGGSRQ